MTAMEIFPLAVISFEFSSRTVCGILWKNEFL